MRWASAVNRMLERIEQQTDMLRTTFDSAAHDLRGPLYRARVRIEESLQHPGMSDTVRETMEATLAELDRVQRTLGTLLQIAQADGRGREVPTEEVDVAALARELVELYQTEAGTRDDQRSTINGEDAATVQRQQPAAGAGRREPDRERHQICPDGGRIEGRA